MNLQQLGLRNSIVSYKKLTWYQRLFKKNKGLEYKPLIKIET